MRSYRDILKSKLKDTGLSQRSIAQAMGWSSNATVSLVLSGKREWAEGELQAMCQIAGVTVAWLAANSDDLHLATNKASVELAAIADELTPDQREMLLSLAKSMKK